MTVSGIQSQEILKLCERVSEPDKIIAACLYGSRQCGYSREDSDYDALLILEDYQHGVRYQYEGFRNVYLAILKVDRELFELDVAKGALGGFVAGRLLSPYLPLIGDRYLNDMEILLKENIAEEELAELVLGYGELARGLVIRPEYIVLSRMRRRSKVYPPLRYSYLCLLRKDLVKTNMPRVLKGYIEALLRLSKKGMIKVEDGDITLCQEYVDQILSKRTTERVVNIVRASQRALYSYIAHGRAGRMNLDMVAKELASKIKRELTVALTTADFEDPNEYLSLKTSAGPINLDEAASITDAVRKLRRVENITVKSLGGALNEVYLVNADDEQLVAKRFSDWYGFKWFTLNLVALGTKIFSVSGRVRLSNEYGMSTLLADSGISVPPVVYVSVQERLLIKRYVEGRNLRDVFESYLGGDHLDAEQKGIASEVGSTIARIHALGITIGDSKPENFISSNDDRLYILDLEQAKKKGDKGWDIAEFLYFTGHYGIIMTGALEDLTRSFIEGYREFGEQALLRKAAGISYAKVFSFWTPPQIIHEISTILRRA
jgi:tRNA A-37 threonylcarbamoyl transferase component Bud32/predicted nucleotidyltransferase